MQSRRSMVLAMALFACAPSCGKTPPAAAVEGVDATATAAPTATAPPALTDLDGDGVSMLFPSAASGSSFRLGAQDPNNTPNFQIENGTPATPATDGAINYFTMPAYDFTYASGGAGKTSRLHIHASGGDQRFTWKTQQGYLSSPADVKNQELTVYARYRGVYDATRAFFTLKIRGGKHTTDGDLASCVMLTLQSAESGAATRFGKELTHPNYDYVKLTPAFDTHLVEGVWFGLKLVSYGVPNDATRVVNRLYADTDPFDPVTGKPKNGWRLLSEYVDVEGVSTGKLYTKLVDWGGWQTTFRTDGVMNVDFAIVSVREIVPPK